MSIISHPANENFRNNWDETFGKKTETPLSPESEALLQAGIEDVKAGRITPVNAEDAAVLAVMQRPAWRAAERIMQDIRRRNVEWTAQLGNLRETEMIRTWCDVIDNEFGLLDGPVMPGVCAPVRTDRR